MIKIKRVQQEELVKFIKRLLSIDSSIYLKLQNGKITSDVYTPDKCVVKTQTIDVSDVFALDLDSYEPYKDKLVKIAFFQGKKLVEMMEQFNGGFSAEITLSESNDGYLANTFKMFDSDELEINLVCSDPALTFEDFTEEQIGSIFNFDDYSCKFSLTSADKSSLKLLLSLEKDVDTFEMQFNDELGVQFKGADIKRKLITGDLDLVDGGKVILSKKYFNFLDEEDYQLYVSDMKVTFESLESKSMLTVSVIQDS